MEKRVTIHLTEAQAVLLRYALRKAQQEFEPYNSPSLDALAASVEAQTAKEAKA
jgi:hypothetical protein